MRIRIRDILCLLFRHREGIRDVLSVVIALLMVARRESQHLLGLEVKRIVEKAKAEMVPLNASRQEATLRHRREGRRAILLPNLAEPFEQKLRENEEILGKHRNGILKTENIEEMKSKRGLRFKPQSHY